MPRWRVNQTLRHYRRYRQIGEALLRQGFGYFIDQLDLRHILPFRRRLFRRKEGPKTLSLGVRLRLVCEELGPSFVKLGQALSTRADLLPHDVIEELSALQDEVPPFPVDEVVATIESELGNTLDALFASFDRTPVAAASISQVHRARLLTGEAVVVKVRRPRIESIIQTDIEILTGLAHLVKERLRTDVIDPVQIVREFARVIRKELDFRVEGRHMDRFRENFSRAEKVHIPKVYWEYTTEKLLVAEFVEGIKVSDLGKLDEWRVDRRELARRGAEAFLQQVMLDGIFHGDPHPGNLLVEPDGTLTFIDFGVVGRLDKEAMNLLADVFIGIVRGDAGRIVTALSRLGAIPENADVGTLRLDVSDMLDRHYGKALGDIQIGAVFADVAEIAYTHRLHLPAGFLLLARALVTMEGVGHRLDPNFNVVEIAEPFAARLIQSRLDPQRLAGQAARETWSYVDTLARIPRAVESALDRFNRGETEIAFRHKGLERLIHRLDVVSNRLSLSVVIGALIVGSSLVIQARAGPVLFDMPLVGILGYVVAGLFGLALIISIVRSGRF